MRGILKTNPGFSTMNRVGWEVEIVDEDDKWYYVKDKLGVKWPEFKGRVEICK